MNRYEFEKCVHRYNGDYRTRRFNCWNQFAQLFFGQLTSRNSLRDIATCLKAHRRKLYHLGMSGHVNQSSLSRANEGRDWRIFADYGQYLMGQVRPLYAAQAITNVALDNEVFALDSTTISLSLVLFGWASGKYSRGAVKIHALLDLRGSIPSFLLISDGKYHDSNVLDVLAPSYGAIYLMDRAYVDFEALYRIHRAGAFFITRAKANMNCSVIEQSHNIDLTTGLRGDKRIVLNGHKSRRMYPEPLRLVEYYDRQSNARLSFLTNNEEVSALEVAELYRNRWQIEIFFKWIKQNLTIKKLWGHSKNAVKTHVWIAICTYLIVAKVKHSLGSRLSIYEIIQILGVSAMDKTPLLELLTERQSNQNINEQTKLF